MTIEEVVAPVMLPIAFGITALAVLWLIWHVARRYPDAPKRVPTGIRIDGRPGRFAPKATLWLAPVIIAVVSAVLAATMVKEPPRPEQRLLLTLVILTIAEVAVFTGWTIDREIELARKMTFRVAPSRTLRALLPILATIVAIVFVVARP